MNIETPLTQKNIDELAELELADKFEIQNKRVALAFGVSLHKRQLTNTVIKLYIVFY
jgi:hypothetical protein